MAKQVSSNASDAASPSPSTVSLKTEQMVGGGHRMEASRADRGSKKKHVKSIRTTKGKGGHVLDHEYEHGPDMGYTPSTQHIFGAGDGVKHVEHYIRHAGIKGVKAMAHDGGGEDADAGEKGGKD